jgi:von Willebrand factor type A domain
VGRKAGAFGSSGSEKKTGGQARKRGIRVAGASAVSALLMVLTVQASSAPQASPVMASAPAASAANVAVLDVVMLIDESGSETPAEVADEKRTVETIALSMLNPLSRVTVIGFGGVNHVVPDQDPVDIACQPTIASGADLNYLASCVSSLHRRTEAEGDDTDYAAALGQAMTYFNQDTAFGKQSPAGAIKVVLMMTDGGADVHRDTQQYGTDWMLGEQQAVGFPVVMSASGSLYAAWKRWR